MRSVIYHFKHLEQKPSPLYLHLYSHAGILYSDAILCAPHTQLSRDVCALKVKTRSTLLRTIQSYRRPLGQMNSRWSLFCK